MSERLTFSQILLLAAYAVGMCGGQILFKAAATRYGSSEGSAGERLLGLFHNAYFISAVLLYGGLAVLWVWVLSFTPLSRAYPFVALAFALTPLFGGLIFGEMISTRLLAGIGFILAGLFLVIG